MSNTTTQIGFWDKEKTFGNLEALFCGECATLRTVMLATMGIAVGE